MIHNILDMKFSFTTIFRFITLFCGTDNNPHNNLIYFPGYECGGEFHGIL